jgi:hypothetical protein
MSEISTEHGIFTSNDKLGLSAEEVYQEWLENKDKPPEPTVEERLEALEAALLDMILGGGL